uniref:t-SNARE coiled-coil homology domain-containing protein n=1 Tax=Palpitomonas bilix TaxID=652834 RepID=A0A7S3GIJ9_9EUKA|mmetsp:Transcript_5079/g.11079  ORF Transcript_5079/g.11079 Transcript_5079/m.11079 type:complete len:266 (+) Transcript_5079:207-1004(+)
MSFEDVLNGKGSNPTATEMSAVKSPSSAYGGGGEGGGGGKRTSAAVQNSGDVDDLALQDVIENLQKVTHKLKSGGGARAKAKDIQIGQALAKDLKTRMTRRARELKSNREDTQGKKALYLHRMIKECNVAVKNFQQVMNAATEEEEEEMAVTEQEKVRLMERHYSQEVMEDDLRELQRVEEEMGDLVSLMSDMKGMVDEQKEALDQTERNTEEAKANVEQGKKELRKAFRFGRKFVMPIVGAIVGGVVLGPVGGVIGMCSMLAAV